MVPGAACSMLHHIMCQDEYDRRCYVAPERFYDSSLPDHARPQGECSPRYLPACLCHLATMYFFYWLSVLESKPTMRWLAHMHAPYLTCLYSSRMIRSTWQFDVACSKSHIAHVLHAQDGRVQRWLCSCRAVSRRRVRVSAVPGLPPGATNLVSPY
jgi:hypothetical protein